MVCYEQRQGRDIFNLVHHLDPSLNFGQVRQVFRGFVGTAPTYPAVVRERTPAKADRPPQSARQSAPDFVAATLRGHT